MLFGTSTKAQWNQYLTGQESLFRDISVVNDNVIWIKDQNGVHFSITTNGGKIWVTKEFPVDISTNAPGGLSAVNETTAYIVVGTGINLGIYKTTNSGDSWVKQTSGFSSANSFPNFIHFWNENEGVAVGDGYSNLNFEIYTTNNGGAQWNLVPTTNLPTNISDYTPNSNSSYRIVGNSMYFKTNKGKIYKSNDKGINWQMINTPLTNGTYMSFDFKDSNNGLLVNSPSGSNTVIYSTINGGLNWTLVSSQNVYQDIKYIPTQNVYLSTHPWYGLSYSADNGQTWTIHPSFKNAGLGAVRHTPSGKIFIGGWKYMYSSTNYSGINLSINKIENTSSNNIDVTFNQEVDNLTSQDTTNYRVYYSLKSDLDLKIYNYPIKLLSAKLDNLNKTLVHLKTGTNFPLDTIVVNAKNINDLSGFPIINSSSNAFGQFIINNVNITAGNLATILNSSELSNISNLKLSGTIDARDFVTMRDNMPKLSALDLSEASIDSYTGTDGPSLSTMLGGAERLKSMRIGSSSIVNETAKAKDKIILNTSAITNPNNETPTITLISNNISATRANSDYIVLPLSQSQFGKEAAINSSLASYYSELNSRERIKTMQKEDGTVDMGIISTNEKESANFTSIIYPSNEIPQNAFYSYATLKGKTTLKTIILPSTLTSIGKEAFLYTGLTSINFPASLYKIGDWAFQGTNLSEVNIPSSVKALGKGCFFYTPYNTNFNVSEDNTAYSSLEGILFSKDKSSLITFPIAKNISSYVIPTTVKVIEYGAFYYIYSLDSITFPTSLTNINEYGFYSSNLSNLDLSKCTQLQSIGDFAFQGCSFSTLKLPASLQSIGQYAFSLCPNIITADLSKNIALTKIKNFAFWQCQYLADFSLPLSIDSIGYGVILECNRLKSILVDSNNPNFTSSDGILFNKNKTTLINYPPGKSGTKYILPTTITQIGDAAFRGCLNLRSIDATNSSLTKIGMSSFYSTYVTDVSFPSTLVDIGPSAFKYCSNLLLFKIVNSIPPTLGTNVFFGTNLYNTTLNVITGSKTVYLAADQWKSFGSIVEGTISFAKTINLTTPGTLYTALTRTERTLSTKFIVSGQIDARDFVIMRDSLRSLSELDLSGANISAYNGTLSLGIPGNSYYAYCAANTIPMVAFAYSNYQKNDTIYFSGGKLSLKSIILPNSATSIRECAFPYTGLTSINIPSTISAIQNWTFYECDSLKTAFIPKKVTIIGNEAFGNCNSLSSVTFDIPSQLTYIGNNAFENCYGLKTLAIPSSLISIGNYAFSNCFYWTGVKSIPSTLTSIGEYAFNNCMSWADALIIPSSVNTIGKYAFSSCGLSSVFLADGIRTINQGVYKYCKSLTTISIPSTVTSIANEAFTMCSGSISVDSQNSKYSSLDGILFDKAKNTLIQCTISKTGSYIIPSTVNSIGYEAFYGNILKSVTIPSSVVSIAEGSFQYCDSLTSILTYNKIPIDLSLLKYVFYGVNKTKCILYVPTDTKKDYQIASKWKDFLNIVETTTSLPSEWDKSVKVYPNPVIETFRINGLESRVIVKIYDLNGNELFTKVISGVESISIRWLPKGVYIVKLISSDGVKEQKIIKN